MEEKKLVIYHSSSGRTKKVASAISRGLGAEMRKVDDFDLNEFKKAHLVGFGSGIYYYKHHQRVRELVESLPERDKKIFVFSTSGCGTTKFHKSLCNILKNKGYRIISEIAFKGFDIYGLFQLVGGINRGKPDEEDLKEAEEFGKSLKKEII